MHHAATTRFAVALRLGLVAALGLVLPTATHADTVYSVSMTTGGLYSFDSASPYTTMTILSGTGTFDSPTALALGPDGNLYIGDAFYGGRISRYNLTTGSVSTVAFVNSGSAGYSGPVVPAAIAFRPQAQGGQMLVGRSPFGSAYGFPSGPVLQIAGWQGNSPVVTDYTTGTTQEYAAGLAVAPDGTLYASNALYDGGSGILAGNVLSFGTTGAFAGEIVPASSVAGPAGLVLSGSTLYTASVMNGQLYATNLVTGSTSQFGPSVGSYEAGALAQLASGDLLTASSGFGGNIYQVWSSGSATLYDSTYAAGELGAAYDLGQIGGLVTMAVPEPTTLALAGCGAMVVVAAWRQRRRPVA